MAPSYNFHVDHEVRRPVWFYLKRLHTLAATRLPALKVLLIEGVVCMDWIMLI